MTFTGVNQEPHVFNETRYSRTEVIAMPDYVLPMLLSRGMELDDISSSLVANRDKDPYGILLGILLECGKYISQFDLKDILSANYILYNNIFNTRSKELMLKYVGEKIGHKPEDTLTLINSYFNKSDVNMLIKDGVRLDSVNTRMELPFSIKFTEQCIFFIMHEGFTNCITHNDNNLKKFYLKVLNEAIYNMYGEDVLLRSMAFEAYICAKHAELRNCKIVKD